MYGAAAEAPEAAAGPEAPPKALEAPEAPGAAEAAGASDAPEAAEAVEAPGALEAEEAVRALAAAPVVGVASFAVGCDETGLGELRSGSPSPLSTSIGSLTEEPREQLGSSWSSWLVGGGATRDLCRFVAPTSAGAFEAPGG